MENQKEQSGEQPQEQSQEVSVTEQGNGKLISMIDPSNIMQFGLRLKAYITQNKLSVNIKGNEYAMTDGWKFAGMNFGIVPMAGKPVRIEQDKEHLYVLYNKQQRKGKNGTYEVVAPFMATNSATMFEEHKLDAEQYKIQPYYAYECSCELKNITTGAIIGQGHAVCSNAELAKCDFDAYAIASMAQTRAIGKAFRNLLGYIMKAAGYEPTTAEEAEGSIDKEPSQTIKATAPIEPEQASKIMELLEWVPQSDVTDSIRQDMHKFTKERADKCIEYLIKRLNQTDHE